MFSLSKDNEMKLEKVEIKLHPDLVKQGLGFTDTNGNQELRHEAGKSIVVERTAFVNLKIQSGEVTLIKTIEDGAAKVETTPAPITDDKNITITPVPFPTETEEEKKKAKK